MSAAVLLAALMAPSPAIATPAPAHVAVLRCGGATFRASSRSWAGRDAPLAPYAQSLTVAAGRQRRAVAGEPVRTVVRDGYRVRQTYVGSWACVQATTGRSYVDLGYSCTADPGEPGDCGGDKEWFRLVDPRGRSVDAGVPRNGAARDRLLRRLGLDRQAAAGITMTSVLPD